MSNARLTFTTSHASRDRRCRSRCHLLVSPRTCAADVVLTDRTVRCRRLSLRVGAPERAGEGRFPEALDEEVAAAASAIHPRIALTFRSLADQIHASLTRERLLAQLTGFLGVLALLLAGLGLYGVTAYAISRRRTEIAVRMALGAAPSRVIALVLGRVWILIGAGILAGAGISLWGSRFIAGLIYGLAPRDPMTLVGAAVLLCVMGGLAGWFPARKAARLDPVAVLRES